MIHSSNDWIVDSGATAHMVTTNTNLTNVRNVVQEYVKTADYNGTLKVDAIGDTELVINLCGERKYLTLKNVNYVPNLRNNLISVKQLVNMACEVRFKTSGCYIFNEKYDTIATGSIGGNLFILDTF